MNKKWTKFYTPQKIAEKMIQLLPSHEPVKKIADICVGSGNLLLAARKKWPYSTCYGIDVDAPSIEHFNSIFSNAAGQVFNATDTLKLKNFLDVNGMRFSSMDLVVANPPFGSANLLKDMFKAAPSCRKGFLLALYAEAKKLKRIEAFMIISNLLLLKPGGYFAAILPENIFSAQSWEKYKSILINKVFSNVFIGRANQYFDKSDVRTRIFIGQLNVLEDINILYRPRNNPMKFNSVKILRGTHAPKINPKKIDEYTPVFHTDTFSALSSKVNYKPKRYIHKKASRFKKEALLKKNDIIFSRVERNCGRVEVIKNKYVGWHISDCVILLRGFGSKATMLGSLLQNQTKRRRGLAARYITKNDVVNSVNRLRAFI